MKPLHFVMIAAGLALASALLPKPKPAAAPVQPKPPLVPPPPPPQKSVAQKAGDVGKGVAGGVAAGGTIATAVGVSSVVPVVGPLLGAAVGGFFALAGAIQVEQTPREQLEHYAKLFGTDNEVYRALFARLATIPPNFRDQPWPSVRAAGFGLGF